MMLNRTVQTIMATQLVDNPRKAGIPAFLQTENRRPLTAAEQARVGQFLKAAPPKTVGASFKKLSEVKAAEDDARFAKLKRLGDVRRERERAQGKWVPGCSWDVKRSRWVHPTSKWNGTRWVSKQSTETASQTAAAQPGEGKEAMSKKAKKKAEPKNGTGRDVSKAPGLVADFKQVREGTARHTVTTMGASGKHTADEIAKEIGKDRVMVMNYLFCLSRDCGYGYEVMGGKVKVTFPGSKTVKDVVKPAAKAA
jgi:hypothetical protein